MAGDGAGLGGQPPDGPPEEPERQPRTGRNIGTEARDQARLARKAAKGKGREGKDGAKDRPPDRGRDGRGPQRGGRDRPPNRPRTPDAPAGERDVKGGADAARGTKAASEATKGAKGAGDAAKGAKRGADAGKGAQKAGQAAHKGKQGADAARKGKQAADAAQKGAKAAKAAKTGAQAANYAQQGGRAAAMDPSAWAQLALDFAQRTARAGYHLLRGNWWEAIKANPMLALAVIPVLGALVLGLILLVLIAAVAGMSTASSECNGGGATLPAGGGQTVAASRFGGPGDPTVKGDSGAGGHLNGTDSFAELSTNYGAPLNSLDFKALGGLPMHSRMLISYRGRSVVAEKRDVGAGGPGIVRNGTTYPRAVDLWYQTAAKLDFGGLDLVQVQPVAGQSFGMNDLMNAGAQGAPAPPAAAAEPPIKQDHIPFGQQRKDEMRAYAKRHYGIDSYALKDPQVIVEHWTDTDTYSEAHNTFVSDAPDPELHERPGTTSHYVVDKDGTIYEQLPTTYMGRHTVGLNYTAIGIEMVGRSASEIFGRQKQLDAVVALTRWLQDKYGIDTANVIGHNESLSSPYHKENVKALQHQTHEDWPKADMDRLRGMLVPATPPAAAAGSCSAFAAAGANGIVDVAIGELGQHEEPMGSNCTKYGPCDQWCAMFTTWVWDRAGIHDVRIPSNYLVANLVKWAQARRLWKDGPHNNPQPGDMIVFGTQHVALVERVFPNGQVATINGNGGDSTVSRRGPADPARPDALGPGPATGYVTPPAAGVTN